MKKYAQNWLWAIILFWILIFSYLVLPQEIQVSYPQNYPRVTLHAYPVDPRDLLRGDYVILNYAFTRPNVASNVSDAFQKDFEELLKASTSGDKVYLVLETDEEMNATPLRFERKKPKEGLFLRGKIYADYRQRNAEVLFGIERYYIPEGTGRELEQARNRGQLMVEVAVHPEKGKALITDVFVEEGEETQTLFRSLDSGYRYTYNAGGTYYAPLSVDIPSGYERYTTTTKDSYTDGYEKNSDQKSDVLFIVQSDGSTLIVKKGDEVLETIVLDDFFNSLPFDSESKAFADDTLFFKYSGETLQFQLFFTNVYSTVYWQDDQHEIDVRDFSGMVFYSLLKEGSQNE